MRCLSVAVVVLALGCAPKNPYLGTWDSEIELMGNRVPLVSTFGEQGAYTATFDVAGAKGTLTGTYTHEKARLRIALHKLDLDTSKSILPKPMVEEGKAAIEKELTQPHEGTVTWDSETTFRVTPDRKEAPMLTFRKRPQ